MLLLFKGIQNGLFQIIQYKIINSMCHAVMACSAQKPMEGHIVVCKVCMAGLRFSQFNQFIEIIVKTLPFSGIFIFVQNDKLNDNHFNHSSKFGKLFNIRVILYEVEQ